MYLTLVIIGLVGISEIVTSDVSKIKIAADGGYEDIVIKIEDDIAEEDCPDILKGIEVRENYFFKPIIMLIHIFRPYSNNPPNSSTPLSMAKLTSTLPQLLFPPPGEMSSADYTSPPQAAALRTGQQTS
jgi:hypothetical protein